MNLPSCGILADLPIEAYHSIKSHYSSTELRLVLPPKGTPALLHRKRNTPPEDSNKEYFLVGKALHEHILDKKQSYRVAPSEYPAEDGKMKKWSMNANYCKDWCKKHADGDILTTKQHEEVMKWVKAIRDDEEAQCVLNVPGRSEVSGFAVCPETGVPLRVRWDWLPNAEGALRPAIGDIKTVKDVDPISFKKAVVNYNWRLQGSMYLYVYNLIAKEHGWPERNDWFFVAVQKSEPYFVKVYGLKPIDLEFGRQQMFMALRTIKHCLETNKWPAYPNEKPGIQMLEFQKWDYELDPYQPYEYEEDTNEQETSSN